MSDHERNIRRAIQRAGKSSWTLPKKSARRIRKAASFLRIKALSGINPLWPAHLFGIR